MTRTSRIVALSLVALAAAAPGAQAQMAPEVSVAFVDEGVDKGWRTVRAEVSGTCGAGAPAGTTAWVEAFLQRAPATAGAEPAGEFGDGVREIGVHEAVEGTSAVFRFRITGGWSAVAVGRIECYHAETSESAERRSVSSASLPAPLRLEGWEPLGLSYRGDPDRCEPPRRRRLQVGAGYDFAFNLGPLDARTLFGHGGSSARSGDLEHIEFHLTGGGAREFHRRVSAAGWRRYKRLVMGYYFKPRKPRPVTMWMTVKGIETNRIEIPVRRRPRGC